MATHRALVLHSYKDPLRLEHVPKPVAASGRWSSKYWHIWRSIRGRDIKRNSSLQDEISHHTGYSAIGHVEETSPDTTTSARGQLVLCNPTIRPCGNPDYSMLLGRNAGFSEASEILMEGLWMNWKFAEHLDPANGYCPADLCYLLAALLPFIRLSDIVVKPGQSLVVSAATDRMGGAAVNVALALSARSLRQDVTGRLQKFEDMFGQTGRLKVVCATKNADEYAGKLMAALLDGGADTCIDLSPSAEAATSYLMSAILALRRGGSCALMVGIRDDVALPCGQVMFKNIRLQSRHIFDRSQVIDLIKMMESGNLRLGEQAGVENVGLYRLDEIEEALQAATAAPEWGRQVVLTPWGGDVDKIRLRTETTKLVALSTMRRGFS